MSVDQSERSDEGPAPGTSGRVKQLDVHVFGWAWQGLIADEMLMWPLQPVSCEATSRQQELEQVGPDRSTAEGRSWTETNFPKLVRGAQAKCNPIINR